MQCRRCCELSCHNTGFLYKRFAPGFTESDSPTVTLPQDDSGWPTTTGGCWIGRPYANLYGSSTGAWHIGGRVYTAGAGFNYDAGFYPDESMYDITGQYRYLDDSDRLFWLGVRTISGFWKQLEVYRYDPSIGGPTFAAAHELLYTQGGPGSLLPTQQRPSVANDVRLGDISADGTKFLYAGVPIPAYDGASEFNVGIFMVDLTTGKLLWYRHIDVPIIYHEDGPATEDGFWWPSTSGTDRNLWYRPYPLMLRIGPDGDAYVTTRPFTNLWSLPSDLYPGFWKLDGTTGHLKGGYGRYAGPLSLGDIGAPYVERAKISIFDHFDVDTDGSVVLCLLSESHGLGVARLSPTADPNDEINTGDSDPDVCVAKGYEEDWIVGDFDEYQLGYGVGLIPDNVVSDGSGGAYFAFKNCLRYTDGSAFATWSKKWGQLKFTSAGLIDPDWIRRSPATGVIHTSTPGGFVGEPSSLLECDNDGVISEPTCCDFTGSETFTGTVTAATSFGWLDTWSITQFTNALNDPSEAWTATLNFWPGCCNLCNDGPTHGGQVPLDLFCGTDEEGNPTWTLAYTDPTTALTYSSTISPPAFTCSPFQATFTFTGATIGPAACAINFTIVLTLGTGTTYSQPNAVASLTATASVVGAPDFSDCFPTGDCTFGSATLSKTTGALDCMGGEPTGFDSDLYYYRGAFQVTELGFRADDVLMYFNTVTECMTIVLIDKDSDCEAAVSTVNVDSCSSTSITAYPTKATDSCCGGGGGSFKLVIVE